MLGRTLRALPRKLILRHFSVASATTATTVNDDDLRSSLYWKVALVTGLALSSAAASMTITVSECEASESNILNPTNDNNEENYDEMETFPIYTAEQVAENNGKNGKPIWMTYGGVVYDVTNFISNHPGGSERILRAAGSVSEPILIHLSKYVKVSVTHFYQPPPPFLSQFRKEYRTILAHLQTALCF